MAQGTWAHVGEKGSGTGLTGRGCEVGIPREPPAECVHLSKAQRFSSQKTRLNKTNRLKALVFGYCDFSDYNGILESRRKREEKKKEREGFEKSGCLFLLLLNYGSFPLKFC